MVRWNVTELVLYTEWQHSSRREPLFVCEKETIREDKIAFVDSFHGGNLSYIIALLDKYAVDKEQLPKDKFGCIWTNSLRKWLRNNDSRKLVDDKVWHGKYVFFGMERFIQLELPGRGDVYADLVDECFHRQLLWCLEQEKEWFWEHDECYIIAQKIIKLREEWEREFCRKIHISADGVVYKKDALTGEKTPLVLEELKALLSYCEQVKEFAATVDKNSDLLHNIFYNGQ